MIIDFHAHAFDDAIAERVIGKLEKTAQIKAYTNGTVSDTVAKMDEWGVDKVVMLMIATKPSQFETITKWSIEIASDRIIPFASVHPDAENVSDQLESLKKIGIKGIKLHPDYQDFYIDEERLFPIYEKCTELEMPIVFHAGLDALCPDNIHAPVDRIVKVIDKFPKLQMILAHLGANEMWEDVYEKIAGKSENVYLDTAFIGEKCSDELMEKIIKKHGANKILFGSDLPWMSPKEVVEKLNRLNLTNEEMELILHKNAEKVLKI